MIAAGQFRADLYFRLAGIVIQIPPLRSQMADLPALALAFPKESSAREMMPPPTISDLG
jgi:DNA-binding NtrC family response regulator